MARKLGEVERTSHIPLKASGNKGLEERVALTRRHKRRSLHRLLL